MTEFEFVFILYALLLGLSLIELLAGLGRALELKLASEAGGNAFKIGILTPALAVFVLLDLLSFWIFAWRVRDFITVSALSLLAVMVFASAYYLAARLVFPSEPDRFADLDTHYFRVRRIILGLLLVLLAAQLGYYASQPDLAAALGRPVAWIMTVVLVALMVAAMWVKDRRWSIAILAALILRYVVIYLL